MGIVLTIAGLAVIAVGLIDMFQTLLHPRGKGSVSNAVISAFWAFSRGLGHRLGSGIGPAGMITAVLVWVVLQGLGWSLIYFPHVPQGFSYSSGINPTAQPDFVEALYISFVTLATLGFGDVVPAESWIRMVAPWEALTGFALLTAALTWFVQIYPPLTRRRSLAMNLNTLSEAEYAGEIPTLSPNAVARVLEELASGINSIRVDLTQHSETYYFQEENHRMSLPRQLPYAVELRDAASASPAPELQTSGRILSLALEQLAKKLQDFVSPDDGEDIGDVFRAYLVDHNRST